MAISDLLSAMQNGVNAINSLNTRLTATFLQQGTVVSTGSSTTISALSTITFTSSQAAGFLTVTTSSGAPYYLVLYR